MRLKKVGSTLVLTMLVSLAACSTPIDLPPRVDLALQCSSLTSHTFSGMMIDSAAVVTGRKDLPNFCQVKGTIDPNIDFEARLPLTGWNGKYYQSGCGGYCGSVFPDKPGFSNTINEALKQGYAAITTDGGHSGGGGDPSFAKGNPVAVEVYADKGIALTHHAGTELVETYFGAPPKRKYFSGCSNGGRMAAMAAQRYPTLFDGILGGSGVLHLSFSGGVYGSWVVQANTTKDGQRILDWQNFAAKLPALERRVLAQCDASDGLSDGVINQPRNCRVDVSALPACDTTPDNSCFTAVEKGVLAKWYQGPRNSAGEQLFPGMPPGSERYIGAWFLDRNGEIAIGNQLGGGYAKYLGFPQGTDDRYTALDFDFDRDPARLAETAKQFDALDPDLRAFRAAGGKYLMWHGWADPLVLPDQSVAYYQRVAETMGGVDAIKPFFRLFMIPGQGHCWELPSNLPDQFDPIAALDHWVETGIAPDSISVHALNPQSVTDPDALLCPYPASSVRSKPGQNNHCPAD